LGKYDSYGVLSRHSGLTKASGDNAEKLQTYNHLNHETQRHGATADLQKQWNQLISEIPPGLPGPKESLMRDSQMRLVEGLTYSGQKEKARNALADMVDPAKRQKGDNWWHSPWIDGMAKFNDANKDPRFVSSLEKWGRRR